MSGIHYDFTIFYYTALKNNFTQAVEPVTCDAIMCDALSSLLPLHEGDMTGFKEEERAGRKQTSRNWEVGLRKINGRGGEDVMGIGDVAKWDFVTVKALRVIKRQKVTTRNTGMGF